MSTETKKKMNEEISDAKNQVQEFQGEYEAIDLDHLVVYVLGVMEENRIRLSFDNASYYAWKMFPKKFSLIGFKEHTDSLRVHTALWHLKDSKKRWISGTKTEYQITDKGRKEIETTMEMLKSPPKKKSYSKTRKREKILENVKKTDAYKNYSSGKEVSQFNLCDLLQCTLDSPTIVLKENYDTLYIMASESSNDEVVEFLIDLKKNFGELKND